MTSGPMTASAHSLIRAMWRLWTDHVVWTRDYIMTATADRPDPIAALPSAVRTPAGEHVPAAVFEAAGSMLGEADAAAARLLKNQEDIGHASSRITGRTPATS